LSHQRRANHALLFVMVGAPALMVAASLIPGTTRWTEAAMPILFLALAVAAAGGVTLPVVSALLDRFGYTVEPYGRTVRRVGLAMALLLALWGAGTAWTAGGLWKAAGAALLAAAVAAFLLVRPHRPHETRSGPEPGFAATVLGCMVFFLAFVTLPYFAYPRAKAYENAMRSDLRNIAAHQEMHRDSAGVYSADPTFGGAYPLSTGVRVALRLTPDGWAAAATHEQLPGTCALFQGSTPEAPAREPGFVACDTRQPSAAGGVMSVLSLLALISGTGLLAAGMLRRRDRAPLRAQAVK